MKNLKITDDQHARICAEARESGLAVGAVADALLNYSLSKLDAGAIRLRHETITVEEPVTSEAQEGAAA